jgi:hypothetical protein
VNGTVDLVVAGDADAARALIVEALHHGRRVLVVLRARDPQAGRHLRRCLREAAGAAAGHLTVMTDAEVVCVDGVEAVEAVVVRHRRTGQLEAVNASGFVSYDPCSSHW